MSKKPETMTVKKQPNIFQRFGGWCKQVVEDIKDNPLVLAIGGALGSAATVGVGLAVKAATSRSSGSIDEDNATDEPPETPEE